jgi:hypothetical protein
MLPGPGPRDTHSASAGIEAVQGPGLSKGPVGRPSRVGTEPAAPYRRPHHDGRAHQHHVLDDVLAFQGGRVREGAEGLGGNRASGSIVPGICTNRSRSVARRKRPLRSPRPISDSQAARTGRPRAGPTAPKVRRSMVRVARSAAGLQPGTNLMAPNHRNTMPRAMRVTRTPCAAIHVVMRRSIGSSRLGSAMVVSGAGGGNDSLLTPDHRRAEHVAVETQRRGHVERLEQRADAVEREGHGCQARSTRQL